MDIFIASFDSRNFSFEAFGKTEKQARTAFAKGLAVHRKQYGAAVGAMWVNEAIAEMEVRKVEIGAAYCDQEPLFVPAQEQAVG